jgi:hypothetical protein
MVEEVVRRKERMRIMCEMYCIEPLEGIYRST